MEEDDPRLARPLGAGEARTNCLRESSALVARMTTAQSVRDEADRDENPGGQAPRATDRHRQKQSRKERGRSRGCGERILSQIPPRNPARRPMIVPATTEIPRDDADGQRDPRPVGRGTNHRALANPSRRDDASPTGQWRSERFRRAAQAPPVSRAVGARNGARLRR